MADDWKTRVTQVRPSVPSKTDGGERACLVMIYPPGPGMGKRTPLEAAQLVVGRGADSDLQLDRDSVSRKHARFMRHDGEWCVEDLGSTNGTFVGEEAVTSGRRSLKDGDLVKVGNFIFKFLTGGNVETAYHEEIYRMTIYDALTEAANKRYFVEFLDRELARCTRHKRPLSLVMFDIDHFKQINDQRGHLTGDHVLRELSKRIRGRIRRDELFARYGGEEFAVVLPEADRTSAMAFAEQVRQLVAREDFEFEGERFGVRVSLGVATTDVITDPQAFIKIADDNLYKAKRQGRDRVIG
jgi:diguanylate cyclase (GGDEF)-like protein